VRRIAATGVYHVFHIQRIALLIGQLMRAEEFQRFAALFAFMDHGLIADIRGRLFVNQADGAQLFFPPFTPHLPQLAIPPVSTEHTGKRTRNKFVWYRVTAVLFTAQLLEGRRDNIKAHGLSGHPFP